MGHVVTSPLVVVKLDSGSYAHVYEGGFLPDEADADHVDQLVEGGMVEEADAPDDDDKPTAKKAAGKSSKG